MKDTKDQPTESTTIEEQPVEKPALPEETILEEIHAPEDKRNIRKITKYTLRLPKTEIIEVLDQTVDEFLNDIIPVTVCKIDETPEMVELTQVNAETGEVTKVKKTNKVIHKEKEKKEVTDISTDQKDEGLPVTTATLLEEKTIEKDKYQEITDVPEKAIVEEIQTPESNRKIKKVTKHVVKKTFEIPKTETIEEILDQTVDDFLQDVIPDTAQIIEETPTTVKMSHVHAQAGEITTVKKTKKDILQEKDGKQEDIEISTVQMDDETPVTTVTIFGENSAEENVPQEITKVPEETIVDEIQTPENNLKIKKIAKKTVETPKTEIIEGNLEPTVVDLLYDIIPDTGRVIDETPVMVKFSQVCPETDVSKSDKSTKKKSKVINNKGSVEIAAVQKQISKSTDFPEDTSVIQTQNNLGKSTLAKFTTCINIVKFILDHHNNDSNIHSHNLPLTQAVVNSLLGKRVNSASI